MKALINRHDFHWNGINNNKKRKNNQRGTENNFNEVFFDRSVRVAEAAHLFHPFLISLVKKDRFKMFVVVGSPINSLSDSNILRKISIWAKKHFLHFHVMQSHVFVSLRFVIKRIALQQGAASGGIEAENFFYYIIQTEKTRICSGMQRYYVWILMDCWFAVKILSLCFVRHRTLSNPCDNEAVESFE